MTPTTSMDSEDFGRPRAREDLVFRSLAQDWVIYDPRTRLLHVLNATAALVWSHCDGSLTPEDIADELGKALTNAPAPQAVAGDVRDALSRFATEGLLD